MPRTLWAGSLSFGLVNCPVVMNGATSEKRVRFIEINRNTGNRSGRLTVDSITKEPITSDDIIKGYEHTKNEWVEIDPDALKALAPEQNKALTIEKFVDASEIDPLLYNSSYYLVPPKGAEATYSLVVEAMRRSGRIGIGKMVYYGRERLMAVRPKDNVLVASMMVFADEIVEAAAPAITDQPEKMLALAESLIEAMTEPFDHTDYEDEHRAQVLAVCEAAVAGKPAPKAKVAPKPEAPDLMAALEASLAAKAPKAKAPRKAKVAA